jgi:hypothetical protein
MMVSKNAILDDTPNDFVTNVGARQVDSGANLILQI